MAGAGMVGMGVGDDCALDRAQRVDEEPAGLAIEAGGQDFQPGGRMRRHCSYVVIGASERVQPAAAGPLIVCTTSKPSNSG